MEQQSNFDREVVSSIEAMGKDNVLKRRALEWMVHAGGSYKYSYNFSWLGRPIIQYPQDMVALQEIIWSVRPELIIETGVAHGGSLIFSASILAMLEYHEAVETGSTLDPANPRRKVLGIDIDIRDYNRAAIAAHPMAARIDMIQGSSIDEDVVSKVKKYAQNYERILVILDSNHTHDHVLSELEAYAKLSSLGSYCVVFDTIIEDVPDEYSLDRPWSKGNNPKTAVWAFLESHPEFEIDKSIENKLQITVAPDGFLKRIR